MDAEKRNKVRQYMQAVFGNSGITLQPGQGSDAPPDEVFINGEFVGVVYQNEDDGEVSYDFIMSMLEEDLAQ